MNYKSDDPVILDSKTMTSFNLPIVDEVLDDVKNSSESVDEDKNNSEIYIQKMVDNKIESINKRNNVYGVGKVVSVKDFILEVVGLESVSFNEKVDIDNKGIGYVVQMKSNRVSVALLSQTKKINVGDSVYQTNELLEGEFSTESFGRVIDMFGNDKLTNKKFSNTFKIPIEIETVI